MKTTLSVNSPPPRRPVLRSDATRPGSWFFVRDSVIMNSIQNLVFVVFDLNQELRTDPRSGTKNFPRRTVNCSTENQFHFALSNP